MHVSSVVWVWTRHPRQWCSRHSLNRISQASVSFEEIFHVLKPSWNGLYITFSRQCSVCNGPSFNVQLHYLSWRINIDTNHLTFSNILMPQHSPMTSSDSSCLFHIFWVYAVTLECHLLQVCNIFSGISLVETHPLMIKFLRRALRTTV